MSTSFARRLGRLFVCSASAALAFAGAASAGHDTTTGYSPTNVLHLNVTNNQNLGGETRRYCTIAGTCLTGENFSTAGTARGVVGATSAPSAGVLGRSDSSAVGATGVHGLVGQNTGATTGVVGENRSTSANATGVYGVITGDFGPAASYAAGVRGRANGAASGIGVHGHHTGAGWGVAGETGNGGIGVYGFSGGGGAAGFGVYGTSNATTANTAGVFGQLTGRSAANQAGVRGENSGACCGMGVAGFHTGNGIGVYGEAQSGFAVSGFSPDNWSGYFQGSVRVVGNLQKNSGSFTIDHPLDPANKYLSHSFVESPDMMNVYNGNVRTNATGFATVKLPRYFHALNRDFRYQLTAIGQPAQMWIAKKIRGSRFTIRTDKPNVEVSWQVTGIRKDRWANEHRIVVEEPKKPSERGNYLNPELYGKPATQSVVYLPRLKKASVPRQS